MKGNIALIASAAGVTLSILALAFSVYVGTGSAIAGIVLFANIVLFFASLGSKSLDIKIEDRAND